MNKLGGKKVDRSRLFDSDSGSSSDDDAGVVETQELAAFEKMMEARVGLQVSREPVADAAATQTDVGEEETSSDLPMFRLFAGSGPVKVETKTAEIVYIMPKRPEIAMEESDSEDHWSALAAAATDAQTIRAVAQIPLPAMQYPRRVIRIALEAEPQKPGIMAKTLQEAGKDTSAPASRRGLRRHHRRKQDKGKLGAKTRSERYVRVLSPYIGGLVKGKMLADVIREEEVAAAAALRRASSTRGGRGRGSSSSGFVGRGRGRGRGRGH